jgi:hypothetical protein
MDNSEILKIVKTKNFNSFWECFDFLQIAGYPIMDSMSVSLLEFGEDNMFSKVAFIRVHSEQNYFNPPNNNHLIFIGLINEENVHLSGLYNYYRKSLVDKNFKCILEIENTCKTIMIKDAPRFIFEYIRNTAKNYYGEDIMKINESSHLLSDYRNTTNTSDTQTRFNLNR